MCCTTPVKRRRTLAALCLILRQHPVSDAKLIDDVALFTRRHAHFLADVLHVDLQLLDAAIVRIPPDRPNDGGIRQHLSRMDGEKRHDVVLRLSQVDLFFANKDLPRIIVDQQILKAEFSAGGTFLFFAVPMAAENGADTGQQFLRPKGLGNIIIRPQIQRLHLVPLVGAGGEHNDGHGVRFPDFLNQVQTIPIRQAEIQNDEIRTMGGVHHYAERTGLRAEHLIVTGFQIGFDKASDVGLVLYDQDLVLVIAHRPHPLFPAQSGIPHRRPSCFLR